MYSLSERASLVQQADLGGLPGPEDSVAAFLDSLPEIYAARDLNRLGAAIAAARRAGRPVFMALGGHVIKCGLSPLLIDLMERGVVNGLLLHGAGAIHDFELAMVGHTSEDVGKGLADGSFGMSEETSAFFHSAAQRAAQEKCGLGQMMGQTMGELDLPNRKISLLGSAHRLDVSCAVVASLGTDIIHVKPEADWAHIGQACQYDFQVVCSMVADLEGGVWLNIGSAVILPEIFLKALTVARNLGHTVQQFTTVNLDKQEHYRPRVNVLQRPGGDGIQIIGHHEILLPLLRACILREMAR